MRSVTISRKLSQMRKSECSRALENLRASGDLGMHTCAVIGSSSILDASGAYIYKERSSNTKNYRVQTSWIDAMGVDAPHRKVPISIQCSSFHPTRMGMIGAKVSVGPSISSLD